MKFFVGTAGWTVPKQHLALFSAPGESAKRSHLERYASRLCCTEINSSFHRPHRRATWERWAATTPDDFRFAVKAPKAVTHIAKLVNTGGALLEFFDAVRGLGHKLGPVLVQLPPKLAFDDGVAQEFFTTLRELHLGAVVLEPRHPSWFTASADRLLRSFEIARVAADPPKGSKLAARPGGWEGLLYWRLHGAPRTYYSEYDETIICSCRRCFAHSVPDYMTGGVLCSPHPASSRIDAGRLCRLQRCFEMLAGLHHSI
jgi:uncharacterized protein YecE (DUF72 family)